MIQVSRGNGNKRAGFTSHLSGFWDAFTEDFDFDIAEVGM
jgi:hypothetical protein